MKRMKDKLIRDNKLMLVSLGIKDNSFSQMGSIQLDMWIRNTIGTLLLTLEYFTKDKVLTFVIMCSDKKKVWDWNI